MAGTLFLCMFGRVRVKWCVCVFKEDDSVGFCLRLNRFPCKLVFWGICLIVRVFCAECNIFPLFLLLLAFEVVTILHHVFFLLFVFLLDSNGKQWLLGEF